MKGWLAKGAQPSDRVSRFLDEEGIKKREPHKNPQKAIPRKERKAMAEEGCQASPGCAEAGSVIARSVAAPSRDNARDVARIGAAHGVRGDVSCGRSTADHLWQ